MGERKQKKQTEYKNQDAKFETLRYNDTERSKTIERSCFPGHFLAIVQYWEYSLLSSLATIRSSCLLASHCGKLLIS